MPRQRAALRNWTEYLAARLAVMGMLTLDAEANLRSAGAIGRWMHRLDHRHRRRARAHIAMCFPEKDDAWIDRLTLRSFEHLAQLLIEIIHLPRLVHPDSWHDRLKLGDLGLGIKQLNAGRPLILLTGHMGNWEALGYLLALMGYPVHAVARPLNNPILYRWLLSLREVRGLRVITKWDATDKMLEVLDSQGTLGFIADQNAGDKGLFVPFFGRLASTYKSVALLAIRRDVPIICGQAMRLGDRYEFELSMIDVIEPSHWRGRRDPLYYVTARYVRALETMVRRSPHQYLWMHRRWKSRPRFEREGKPMPASLRRNLEDLPWMDQATLDQLAAAPPPPAL